MSAHLHRSIAVPLFCALCLCVQIALLPDLRLPLPLAMEDFFIADWLQQKLPLTAHALQTGDLWRVISYALLHGSWWHLIANLFGLWITGRTLEMLVGLRKTCLILFMGAAAGAAGFIASLLLDPRLSPHMTCIGASAMLTACIGALSTVMPKADVTLFITVFPIRLRAFWLIPVMLLLFTLESLYPQLGTAYGAHLGGWLAGLLGGYVCQIQSNN
jgi:membrane associated rhomboid family serine protease